MLDIHKLAFRVFNKWHRRNFDKENQTTRFAKSRTERKELLHELSPLVNLDEFIVRS